MEKFRKTSRRTPANFTEHEAVYHKICVSEYKAQKLQRAMKRN